MTNNTNSMSRFGLQAVALVAALVVSSCGGDTSADDAKPAPKVVDLTAFLIGDNEEPGLRLEGSPTPDNDLESFARNNGLSETATDLLRSSGFEGFVFQQLSGTKADGVSNVMLFETAEGAKAWMAYDQSEESINDQLPGVKVGRFSASGIPGSAGWTAPISGLDPVANLAWVQGRCVLVLGNQGPGKLTDAVAAGAEALYRRTKGECP